MLTNKTVPDKASFNIKHSDNLPSDFKNLAIEH